MSYNRITIALSKEEIEVLRQSASRECRRPREHARYILLSSLGLMTTNNNQSINAGSDTTQPIVANRLTPAQI